MMFRRNFLSLVLLAPLAKLAAPFRSGPTWTPLNVKFTRIMGRMYITPEAYAAVRSDKTAFNDRTREILKEYYERSMVEMDNELLNTFPASGRWGEGPAGSV